MSVCDTNSAKIETASKRFDLAPYKCINTRLQELKTRLEKPEYNEQQQLLFSKFCDGLESRNYQKACRFITDCDIPTLDVCTITPNYKEAMPPSQPREELPLNLLAHLLTCCEPGRIACPAVHIYEDESPPTSISSMTTHKTIDIGTGKLSIGFNLDHYEFCCRSTESYDYMELYPYITAAFDCSSDSFEYSGEFYNSFEIGCTKVTRHRKYNMLLNICEHILSFEPSLEISVECGESCEQSFETSIETSLANAGGILKVKIHKRGIIDWCTPNYSEELSVELSQECSDPVVYTATATSNACGYHGSKSKVKLTENATVDWCNGDVVLNPSVQMLCSCEDITTSQECDKIASIEIPGVSDDYKVSITGYGCAAPVLKCDGTIDANIFIGSWEVDGEFGPTGAVAYVEDVTISGGTLEVKTSKVYFENGLYLKHDKATTHTYSLCDKLKKTCHFCECSESSTSSSSHSKSRSKSY